MILEMYEQLKTFVEEAEHDVVLFHRHKSIRSSILVRRRMRDIRRLVQRIAKYTLNNRKNFKKDSAGFVPLNEKSEE